MQDSSIHTRYKKIELDGHLYRVSEQADLTEQLQQRNETREQKEEEVEPAAMIGDYSYTPLNRPRRPQSRSHWPSH
jgi:hypothetical protein